MAASEPQQFGEFAILGKLGQGAMGAVYKARQTSLNRIVALKLLPAHYAGDPDFLARFKNESAAAAALNHPNIVQVYAAGEDAGTHFFAMEYVEGESLGSRLERKGRIDPHEAIAVACHIAQALDYAWRKARVIHRDIKPDNIFLSREGTVKVGDLGLAKVLGNQGVGLTQTGAAMGTPYYVSPEQAMGTREIDFRADIYSLGCTIYHAMTGQPPYRGESAMAVMMQHISQPAPRIQAVWPACPPPLIGLLDRMLRKRPEERHESYEALLQQLYWVAERLDQPSSSAAAAASMIVPMPVARSGSTPDASRQAVPIPTATAARSTPPAVGIGKKLAVFGALATTVVALMVWQPWKRPATAPAGSVANGATVASVEKPVQPLSPAEPSPTAIPAPTPVPTPTPPPAAPIQKPVADPEGFTALLESEHLGAWKHCGAGGVTVKDSVATTWSDSGTRIGSWWYGARQYADFILTLEFRIEKPGGNSGVYVRFPAPGNNAQVADRQGYQIDVSEEANPLEMTGAIAFVQAPASVPQKARDWNELEIKAEGQHYVIRLNGTLVNDFTGNKQTSGYIGLQTTSKPGVQYRNIRIKELSSPAIPATALQPPSPPPPAATPKPQSETEKWVAQMDAIYQPMYQRDVTAPFEAGMADLKKNYLISIDRESTSASRAARLNDALAFRNERQRIEAGSGVSADDGDAPPAALKVLRAAYRAQSARLETERRKNATAVFEQYDKLLVTNLNALTQRQRLDEALLLQQRRDALTAEWMNPAMASKERPYVNSLRMKFVPVPGTDVLMCIHLTRRADYAAFAAARPGADDSWASRPKDRNGASISQGDDYPVVAVCWNDAKAFCDWLSEKEGRNYRLPTDREWSHAAGIGDLEKDTPGATPESLSSKIKDVFPWGTQWPPPPGSGNFADASLLAAEPDADCFRNYNDGYSSTSPVFAFKPNRLGLHDLAGNIGQWCEDFHDAGRTKRVQRGGDYLKGPASRDWLLSSHRFGFPPTQRLAGDIGYSGFRCVLVTAAKAAVNTAPSKATASTPPAAPGNPDAGFTSIFNGKDLTGWDGDPQYWSVKNGAITAESPTNGKVPKNTFLIWKDGKPDDFELRLSYKITLGNSGIQYRSKVANAAAWSVGGYQFEMDAAKAAVNGALYEEMGQRRGLGGSPGGLMIANVGEKVRMTPDDQKQVLGALKGAQFHSGTWNDVVITAVGNRITHQLNGVVTIELTDEDPRASAASGVLALQLHAGPPQKVQFKDIRLKALTKPQ